MEPTKAVGAQQAAVGGAKLSISRPARVVNDRRPAQVLRDALRVVPALCRLDAPSGRGWHGQPTHEHEGEADDLGRLSRQQHRVRRQVSLPLHAALCLEAQVGSATHVVAPEVPVVSRAHGARGRRRDGWARDVAQEGRAAGVAEYNKYSEYDYQFLGAWIDDLFGKRPGALAGWLAHLANPARDPPWQPTASP